ncbi:hypothetical protein K505DRAFT_330823 [Melanomma pulvis-pyrius CBS 109.77]|uniref:Diphthamide biosynthesis protein 4 n=1 Tax=Melanomma pulvis-pyrius CBS 109.77 TaxID=1314802 RepID=A0A6A6WP62_9PLEO|nr:hypothetical protein K505DRAFT_330823 [Melanomma pulvis-pyrius CBS 109.77]
MGYSKNYYAILGLNAPLLLSQHISAQELKTAYKKAIFEAHPDKVARRDAEGKKEDLAVKQHEGQRKNLVHDGYESSATSPSLPPSSTVDDVKDAFAVLSSPAEKPHYDAWLAARYSEGLLRYGSANLEWQAAFAKGVLPSSFQYQTSASTANANAADATEFLAGLEVLDLSDFDIVELTPRDVGLATSAAGSPPASVFEMGERVWEEKAEWRRPCRCGSEMGFRILERELDEAERRGLKEVVVGCWGCSLSVRVAFDVEEG